MRNIIATALIIALTLTLLASLYIPGTAAAQTDCVESLPEEMTVDGTWDTGCTSNIAASSGDGDRYARFYTFTLDEESDVTIDLSSDEDTYLYLRSGTATDGDVVADNDDRAVGNYDSLIEERLDAGDYTIEATTYYAGVTGSFTLAVSAVAVPEPTPSPSPEPAPDDDPIPLPSECTESLDSREDGIWTSDCTSLNRTDYGDHYARYYTFTLDRSTTIDLTLESRTDPYLILLSLNEEDEIVEIVKEDDDDDEAVFNLISRNSGIRITLDSGRYAVEATTYANDADGNFTLTFGRPELDALQALYDDAGGADWNNSDNWLTGAPLAEWHGIKTDDEGRVTEIYLIGNNLTGEIPAELANLSRLEGLYLARNELSGSIPRELGDLSSLRTLMLFSNDLTGEIPYQFGNLESLEEMHLGHNNLSGEIPTSLGDLGNLRKLQLTINELSGSIPASLGNLDNLTHLSIGANNLTGSIPAGIADLEELTHIYLWGNELAAGAFIQRLDDLDGLQFLDIGGNRIDGGDVLAELHALDNLTGLGLHDSDLTDADLAEYMDDLQALDLGFLNIRSNDLSDPQTLVGLSGITTLQRLAINDNDFSGELPRTMTRLTLMRLFYFHDNDGLCAPGDREFQDWMLGIRDVRGDTCTGGTPAHAPAPGSGSADRFVAILQTPDQPVPSHSLSALAAGQSGN